MQRGSLRTVGRLAALVAAAAILGAGQANAAKRAAVVPAGPLQASIVVDGTTGEVLQAINANVRTYPASLTKMMTLYLTFDALGAKRLNLATRLPVSQHAAQQSPTKLYLDAGETIQVEDAILGLVTKSANDAAVVLAEALGGTEEGFARMMTRKAREIGMDGTVFRNASGLPDRGQVTTARDLAVLAMALYRDHPARYHYFARQSFEFRGAVYGNHNKLLGRYDGVDGIKTGYIRDSGFNLATSAERDGRRLFAVVMGGQSGYARDAYMMSLLDRGFRLPATEMAAASKLKPVRTALDKKKRVQPRPTDLAGAADLEPVAQGDAPAPGEGGWGIQVGAYQRYVQAQLAASRAVHAARTLLRGASVVIVPVEAPKGMLYRARLVGIGRETAEQACRTLSTQHKFDCVAFETPPGKELAEIAEE